MSLKRLNTPILLIGFNRPDLFQKVLDRVMEVKPKRIYVGLDGARVGRQDDEENLVEIKKLVSKINGSSKGKNQYVKQFQEDLSTARKYTSNIFIIWLHKIINNLIVFTYKIIK